MNTNKRLAFITDLINLPALVRNLFARREVIRVLTWRDFQARYRGSLAGMLWSILQPLLMMTIYTLVFSTFLKVRFNTSDSPFTFAVYLLCGLLPWNTFAEGLAQSTSLIRSNTNLVKRVVFPLEVLPLNLALGSMIQQLIGFALLLPLALIVTGKLGAALLFLPALLLIQLLLVTGINWIWTSLSVYIPDLRHATPALTTVLMFITPILYPENLVPGWAIWVVRLNPIAHLVRMTRGLVIDNALPQAADYGWTGLACLLIFMIGYCWFIRTKSTFADFL
jgi:lipopolysaccharide transport system permease protein